jgi:hypothetical protein
MLICFSILDKLCQCVGDPWFFTGFTGVSKFSVNGLGLIPGSLDSEDFFHLQMVKANLTYYDLFSVLAGKRAAYSVE